MSRAAAAFVIPAVSLGGLFFNATAAHAVTSCKADIQAAVAADQKAQTDSGEGHWLDDAYDDETAANADTAAQADCTDNADQVLAATVAKPAIILNHSAETAATNEAATTNQLDVEAANAAQAAATFDNEAANTLLIE
jgi:hypothetical protein